jgi:Protein of unknown function (DUF2478)
MTAVLAMHGVLQCECDVAGVVYGPEEEPEHLLRQFSNDLTAQGFLVCGLLRAGTCAEPNGIVFEQLPDRRLLHMSAGADDWRLRCRLDAGRLSAIIGDLRHSITTTPPHLLVINRFGRLEQNWLGLWPEILDAAAAEIPVIAAVPQALLDTWIRYTGGMSVKLACRRDSLEGW